MFSRQPIPIYTCLLAATVAADEYFDDGGWGSWSWFTLSHGWLGLSLSSDMKQDAARVQFKCNIIIRITNGQVLGETTVVRRQLNDAKYSHW